jgi:hypothetical protein
VRARGSLSALSQPPAGAHIPAREQGAAGTARTDARSLTPSARQFSARVADLRRQLHESMEGQAHHEIHASAERINETIGPYRRFVETQRARLHEARGALIAVEDGLLRLRSEIERA